MNPTRRILSFHAVRRAFTLVELLVVIAIIGLLSTVAVVATTNARSKARDTKRIADMKQIKLAIDLYYDTNGVYPTCDGLTACTTPITGWGDFTAMNIKPTLMANIPKDPINTAGQYGYYYTTGYKPTGPCSYALTSANDYILATRLENPSAFSNACSGLISGWDNASLNFITGSL